MKLISWLTQDADSPKHTGTWKHPVTACLVHYLLSVSTILIFHDVFLLRLLEEEEMTQPLGSFSLCPKNETFSWSSSRDLTAIFSFVYAILLLSIRLIYNRAGVHRMAVLYEFTWLCNAALLFGGAFGLLSCRPRIATGFAIAVSIDQVLWYVDVLGYCYNRIFHSNPEKMFPIGVCKYLFWPQTQWSAKITCTHHFWTIPLLVYGAGGRLDFGSYLMNVVTVFSHVVLSRWLTPFGMKPKRDSVSKNSKQHYEKYLNVNLAHELWQDIKISFLRRQGDNQTTAVYILRLNLWWQLFNFLCFLLLKLLQWGIVTFISSF